ncbi:MAG: DUF5063 domain-containing protein [Ideonella sp.]|nr:DUF5063 domain-containing protein [Ideonella sp.]
MTDPSEPIAVFHQLALGFCAWCEGHAPAGLSKKRAAQWLARLHAAALDLPATGPDNDWGLSDLPPAELAAAERNLRPFAGWYYRTVFDPDPFKDDEPLMGDVGDDLLDTYKDIKVGCQLVDQGRPADALWHWSFMHCHHWGQHVVGALCALYAELRNDSD